MVARVLVVIGIGFLIVAGVSFLKASATIKPYVEEKFDVSKSKRGVFGGRNEIENWLDLQERNRAAQGWAYQSYQDAQPFIWAAYGFGAVGLVLAGSGLLVGWSIRSRRKSAGSAGGENAPGCIAS